MLAMVQSTMLSSPLIDGTDPLDRLTSPPEGDRDLVCRAPDAEQPWQVSVARCAGLAEDVIVLSDGVVRVGREAGAGADLVLPDPSVSRVHATCVVGRGADHVEVTDEQSRNGVYVNGARVHRATVREGDVVRFGDAVVVVTRGASLDDRSSAIVGRSVRIDELRSTLRRLAPSMLPVLVAGATGTGKELVARALHAGSGRTRRFVAINCAALPSALVENVLFGHRRGAYTSATADAEGAFAEASGGTLFLDEIGDLSLEAQPKLLRALENGEISPVGATRSVTVDVRVVCATNTPLDEALARGAFRRDLYARVAGIVVETPALARRREDIVTLFRSFLAGRDRPMTADFAESLLLHGWPHNVRELRSLAERLTVLFPDAVSWERAMLDEPIRRPVSTSPPVTRAESVRPAAIRTVPRRPPTREELGQLLSEHGGNVARAAQHAGRSRKQVYRWMDMHGLPRGTGR